MEPAESFPLEEQFDRYLDKRMGREAQQEFEQRLEKDAELRASLQSYLAGKRAAWLTGYQQEKAFFDQQLQARKGKTQKRRNLRYTFLSLAAAIALVLVITYWPTSSPQPPEALYAAYFEPPTPPTQMGESQSLSLGEADELFRQQAYPEAAQAYEQLLQKGELNSLSTSRVQLMLGVSYLQSGAFDKARQSLALAEQHREQAQWYATLSWLKEGKTQEAKGSLRLLKGQQGHFYQQQASELLDKLP